MHRFRKCARPVSRIRARSKERTTRLHLLDCRMVVSGSLCAVQDAKWSGTATKYVVMSPFERMNLDILLCVLYTY